MTDYGKDADGTDDADAEGRWIEGPELVIKAIVRRLSTRRGNLYRHPNYGIALYEYLNASFTPQEIAAAQVAIAAECTKDERVLSALAVVTLDRATGLFTVKIDIELGEGPFSFVLAVSSVTVTLLNEAA